MDDKSKIEQIKTFLFGEAKKEEVVVETPKEVVLEATPETPAEPKEVTVNFSAEQKVELRQMFSDWFMELSSVAEQANVVDLTEEAEEVEVKEVEELAAVAVEKKVEPIKPSPEATVEKKTVEFAANRPTNMRDRVFARINNN